MKYAMIQLLCGLAILSVATVALAQDDHGDSWDKATPLVVNAAATDGEINPPNDLDWFSFSTNSGTNYTITVNPVTLAENTRVRLYDPNGTNPVEIDYGGVEWNAPTSDTYYVRVSSLDADYSGTYDIAITAELELDAGLDGGVDGGDWGWGTEETITGGTGECSCRAVGRPGNPLRLLTSLIRLFD